MRDAAAHEALLRARTPFAYAKIDHGLWERLAVIDAHSAAGLADPAELDRVSGPVPHLVEGGFLAELEAMLTALPGAAHPIDFAAGTEAWPGFERVAGYPAVPAPLLEAAFRRRVPDGAITADPMVWRRAIVDGGLAGVVDALRDRTVRVVGPGWTAGFGDFAGIARCRHVESHATEARAGREALVEALAAAHDPGEDPVYLIQAGALSAWLVLRLAPRLERATFLDLGTVLDICSVPKIASWQWSRVVRAEVARTIVTIAPDWPADARAYPRRRPSDPPPDPAARRAMWTEFALGVVPDLAERHGLPPRRPAAALLDRPVTEAERVRFVEDKRPDWSRIEEIAGLSARARQWANFGPVAGALEEKVGRLMRIRPERRAVAAASATAALHALVGLHAEKRDRRLRWVVSAYGFPATAIGPLADATVVDCDEAGLLDLAAVAALPPDAWDGMIVTNPFGLAADTGSFVAFAREHGKALIVDSAAAMFGVDRRKPGRDAEEVVSLHHTKPWGVGEGGVAIVRAEDAGALRDMLNFGIGRGAAARPAAMNGKMSDIAAAAILDRLERAPNWRLFYLLQHARIVRLVREAGLELLGAPPGGAVAGNLPVLLPASYATATLPPARFETRRYYRPLATGMKRAAGIYARMLNLPCHPGMAAVPTEELRAFLAALRACSGVPEPAVPEPEPEPAPPPRLLRWWRR